MDSEFRGHFLKCFKLKRVSYLEKLERFHRRRVCYCFQYTQACVVVGLLVGLERHTGRVPGSGYVVDIRNCWHETVVFFAVQDFKDALDETNEIKSFDPGFHTGTGFALGFVTGSVIKRRYQCRYEYGMDRGGNSRFFFCVYV